MQLHRSSTNGALVLFPPGTQLDVVHVGDEADVCLSGWSAFTENLKNNVQLSCSQNVILVKKCSSVSLILFCFQRSVILVKAQVCMRTR